MAPLLSALDHGQFLSRLVVAAEWRVCMSTMVPFDAAQMLDGSRRLAEGRLHSSPSARLVFHGFGTGI